MRARPGRVRRGFPAASIGLALLLAWGCTRDVMTDATDVSNGTSPLTPIILSNTPGGILLLSIHTYDGSGESVEPDVVHFAAGWHGYEYWMVYDPYPGGNSYYENPSIAVSHDGLTWIAPPGIRNPVVPGPGFEGIIHNSDPGLTYVHQLDRMVLTYRAVTLQQNVMYAVSSSDGINWSTPVRVLAAPAHQLVMPTIVLAPGRRPKLFYVDAGREGCSAQVTKVKLRRWTGNLHQDDALIGSKWSNEETVDLGQPPNFTVWHMDVVWVDERKEYWAIFPAHLASEDCSHNDLFVARSRDAVHWQTLPDPILVRNDAPWVKGTLYRATMEYDAVAKNFQVWFSGRNVTNTWHIGHQAIPLDDLVDQFNGARASVADGGPGSGGVSAPTGRPPPVLRTERRSPAGTSSPLPDVSP